MDTEVLKIVLSLVFGGAFMGFLQFLIQRKDSKDEWKKEILEGYKQLEAKFVKLDLKIDANKLATSQQIDGLREDMSRQLEAIKDENQQQNAIQARIRLLRFADEIRLGQLHSKESYNQASQDADVYEGFCKYHEDFENSMAVSSIKIIRQMYEERMRKNDFL